MERPPQEDPRGGKRLAVRRPFDYLPDELFLLFLAYLSYGERMTLGRTNRDTRRRVGLPLGWLRQVPANLLWELLLFTDPRTLGALAATSPGIDQMLTQEVVPFHRPGRIWRKGRLANSPVYDSHPRLDVLASKELPTPLNVQRHLNRSRTDNVVFYERGTEHPRRLIHFVNTLLKDFQVAYFELYSKAFPAPRFRREQLDALDQASHIKAVGVDIDGSSENHMMTPEYLGRLPLKTTSIVAEGGSFGRRLQGLRSGIQLRYLRVLFGDVRTLNDLRNMDLSKLKYLCVGSVEYNRQHYEELRRLLTRSAPKLEFLVFAGEQLSIEDISNIYTQELENHALRLQVHQNPWRCYGSDAYDIAYHY